MKNYILLICLILFSASLRSQDRLDVIKTKLETFSKTTPKLNEKVELSVDRVSVPDFLRLLSKSNDLNISVQGNIQGSVINDFKDAIVKDVFLYLCREYNLDIEFIGNILFFKKYVVVKKKEVPVIKKLDVSFNPKNQFLSVNLEKDDVMEVAKEISKISGKTVVVYPPARNTKLTSFIQNRDFEKVLDKITSSNGLIVTKTKDDFYIINKETISNTNRQSRTNGRKKSSSENIHIIVKDNLFSIEAIDAPINEIISKLSDKLNLNYFLYELPTEKTTLFVDNMNYEEFLAGLLTGTDFTYKKSNGIYLIGERKKEGFRATELITLKNRSIEAVKDKIPNSLTEGLSINEFTDLNGLIVSGSSEGIFELKSFIESIDIVVPMITLDLIIVEVNKSNGISGGVEMGLGEGANTTSSTGSTSTGQVNLSTNAINRILQSINGLGLSNLGNVMPNFYMNIEALESNQVLKIRSTPKISTLNGQEATLSIGNTEYYLEVNNQIVNTGVSQNVLNSQQYKSVQADLTIVIKPFVSEDEQITLTIDLNQASFTPRISETAPPGQVSRNFKSTIRVRNNEMILLGGLEEVKKNNSGRGLPWVSRVWGLKWLFGKRIKEKSNSKLNIFIRPKVTY